MANINIEIPNYMMGVVVLSPIIFYIGYISSKLRSYLNKRKFIKDEKLNKLEKILSSRDEMLKGNDRNP